MDTIEKNRLNALSIEKKKKMITIMFNMLNTYKYYILILYLYFYVNSYFFFQQANMFIILS